MVFDRSAAVKLQLRDSKGRFIKMGSHVKWTSLASGKTVSGIVKGEHGDSVLIEFKHNGKAYNIHVPHGKVDVIDQKAMLDPAYVEKMGGAPNDTPLPTDPGVTPAAPSAGPALPIKSFSTLSTNETYYRIASADGEKIHTPVSGLQLGDEVIPIAQKSTFQKSPYNAKANSANANIQKFGPGVGKVTKIDPKGNWVVITDENGKTYPIASSHFVFKRDANSEKAVLDAQKLEASTIYAGKTPPSLPWIDSLKGDDSPAAPSAPKADAPAAPDAPEEEISDEVAAADMPIGTKMPVGMDNGFVVKKSDNKWTDDIFGKNYSDQQIDEWDTNLAATSDETPDTPDFNASEQPLGKMIDLPDGAVTKIAKNKWTREGSSKKLSDNQVQTFVNNGNGLQKSLLKTPEESAPEAAPAPDPSAKTLPDTSKYILKSTVTGVENVPAGTIVVPLDSFGKERAFSLVKQDGDAWNVFKDGEFQKKVASDQIKGTLASKFNTYTHPDNAPKPAVKAPNKAPKIVNSDESQNTFGDHFSALEFDANGDATEFKEGDKVVFGAGNFAGTVVAVHGPTDTSRGYLDIKRDNPSIGGFKKSGHTNTSLYANGIHAAFTRNEKPEPEAEPDFDESKFSSPQFVAVGKLKVGDVVQANNALRLRVDAIKTHPEDHTGFDTEISYSIAEGTTAHKAKVGASWGKEPHNSKDQLTTFVAKDSNEDSPAPAATPEVPAESVDAAPEAPAAEPIDPAENPFGDNFEKLPGLTDYHKGDMAVFKDGTVGQWVGKGQITLEDGSKIMGNKFSVNGKEEGVQGKDIAAAYRPKNLVIASPTDHPFGEDAHGYSFDLSKPNDDNFKAGDFVTYGKEKNQGKVMSVNPTNILVEKLNSDKTVHGTPTIVAGQVHGVYRKDGASAPANAPETPAETPESQSKGKAPAFAGPSPQQKIDNAAKMYGEGSKEHQKAQEKFGKDAAEAPADEAPEAAPSSAPTEDAPAASPVEAPAATPATPESDATQQIFPDKGKSITDVNGETVKANDMIHFAGKGVGKVKLVYPSTDSVKVVYPDGKEHVHKSHKITKAEGGKPKLAALPANLKVGDTGIDPTTNTQFIVGKNNTLIHKGDTVTHSSGDKGVVKAIYKGEKTVKVEWADGHSTGPKKSSTLESVAKPDTSGEPNAAPDAGVETPAAPETPVVPYSAADEKALINFKDNFMEIGEHLRGSAEHAFPGAGGIIHDLDDLIKKSELTEDMDVYRGFVTLDPKVIESLVPGTLMYEKSFTSTSKDINVALDALDLGPLVEAPKNHAPGMAPPEVEQSVIVKFELPAGFHAHEVNYGGLAHDDYKNDGHEQEVLLPRQYQYEIQEVADGTDPQGRPMKTVTVKAVHKSGASDQDGPGMHAVENTAEIGSKPFKILEDPGADGDGFHESGPWGHFGASGVMVEAPDPETGEPRYLIVENGNLHEEQNRGLWQLPGGAANGNENPYQAAAREMWEELEVDPAVIADFELAGDVAFANDKGWAYTNIGAKAPKQFDMKLDGYETSGAKWVSADELRAMRDDGSLLPAFGANVDNLLGVYEPKDGDKAPEVDAPEAPTPSAPEAAPDFLTAKPLDMKDFTKVPNKDSGGSNDGAFYTDKDGNEFYLKYNMADGHARDEILASKIYQTLGVNAANQQMLDMGDGKIGVASKIIETDGHGNNIHLDDPEYRKKAQADFAIDALLANWDVAGIGNNNLLTDANGEPLRLDPGAALRFRAQGAKKNDFGPSADEWDFLRSGANSDSSSIKPTAKLFGDMTDEQLKESASKLHELTDDKIDSIVDSVGYEEKDGDFLKATLKARRDDILDRAGVKDTNNEGAPDGAGQAAGEDGTAHEAGPEDGEQVPLDPGTGTDSDAPEAAGTEGAQHQVGAILDGKQISKLPVGSKVEMKSNKVVLTKANDTDWLKDGDTQPFKQGFLDHYSAEYEVKEVPAAAPENSAAENEGTNDSADPDTATEDLPGKPIAEYSADEIKEFPVGTKVFRKNGNYVVKEGDDVWRQLKPNGTPLFSFEYNNADVVNMMHNHSINFSHVDTSGATDAPESSHPKEIVNPTYDDLASLPDGVVLKSHKLSTYKWTKQGNQFEEAEDGHGTTNLVSVHDLVDPDDTYDVLSWPDAEAAAPHGALPAKLVAPTEDDLAALPDGTALTDATMPGYKWIKDGDMWDAITPAGGDHKLPHSSLADGGTYDVVGGGAASTPDAPETGSTSPKVGDEIKPEQVADLPIGSVFHSADSEDWAFKKVSDTELVFASQPHGTKFKINQMIDSAKANPDYRYKISAMPEVAVPVAPPAPSGPKVGDVIKGHYDVYNLPVGAQFFEDQGYGKNQYIKDSDTTFKLVGASSSYNISDLSENTEITITSMPHVATPPSGPSVTGKNGEQIFAGDKITWQTKGIMGKAVEVDAAANKVRMLYPDGSMKWYDAKKMVKQVGPTAKPAAAPVKVNAGDPSSPLYNTPAPKYTAPQTTAEPTFTPDGFIAEIEQRYADKINPSWSKATPQQSHYWGKVESFQQIGDLAALEVLHDKLYISDEMYQKAKDHATAVSADISKIKADNAKIVADALKTHNDELAKWSEANGVSPSTNSITAKFPKKPAQEWDAATGFITNADDTQSANWGQAPSGTYAVDDILASLEDLDMAAHGMSALIDSTSIMNSNVRFNKVVMPDGTVRVQAKFEVSEAARNDIRNTMQAHPTAKVQSGVNVGFTEYAGVGDLPKYSTKVGEVQGIEYAESGKTYSIEDGGTHIAFANANEDTSHGKFSNNAATLRSLAYVTLPENATSADLEKALKAMGVTDAHPSDKAAVDHHKMKSLVSFFDGWVGEMNTKYEDNPQALKAKADKILADKGYSLDHFRMVTTENGFTNVRMPNELRDQMTAASGVKALVHGNMDWVPQGEKKGEFDMSQWDASMNVDRVVMKFARGSKGFLSTGKRMTEGDDGQGMSAMPDTRTGGSRYLFMTPAKTQGQLDEQFSMYQSGVVAHPSLAFQYLTNYSNANDNFQGNREEGATVENMLSGHNPYELMMFNGLSVSDSWYAITNATQKPTVIQALKDQNVFEINGIPIEQYFVVPGIDPIPEWKGPNPELGL